ncbi:MAG: hypothetical protein M3P98_00095 [bacterium]|nr:hypothetical protein [bacterium]
MNPDQNQQPPIQTDPNYDFIMNQGQKPTDPNQAGQLPNKPGFKISKPILFGGIILVVILVVLAVVTLIANPSTSKTSNSATFAAGYLNDLTTKNYDSAFSKLSQDVAVDQQIFQTEFVDSLNERLDLSTCTFTETLQNGPNSEIVTFSCNKNDRSILFDLEVVYDGSEYKIDNYLFRSPNESN